MSQYEQPAPGSNGKKNSSIIYWVVILVLLAGCIYLFVSKNNMAKQSELETTESQQRMDSVLTDRASLQTDFDAASVKIDQLVSQNAKMDSSLQEDKKAMDKMRMQIRTILSNKNATQAELKKAREMITMLTDKTKEYETRIAELEQENTQLTGQNKVLATERDSTVAKNIALKRIGSVLHASNIRMEPIDRRRNGKEKETSKARKVDILRITFDIDENRIAESGNKEIYLRLVAPGGIVLSSGANASGTLTAADGQPVKYSVMKEISLLQNQMAKNITMDWNQNGDYAKGTYTIELYNDGYKVGNGSVTLK